jgi:hypothetical protein
MAEHGSPRGLCWREGKVARDESGSVLIIAIVTLVAVGLLIGALATLATPIFAQAKVTQNLGDSSAFIDAGIEYGIQALQADPSMLPNCVPPFNDITNPPPVNSSGSPPLVTCTTVPASLPSLQSPWISEVVLTSRPPRGFTGRVVTARAVIAVNKVTGATTILSWRRCQDTDRCN